MGMSGQHCPPPHPLFLTRSYPLTTFFRFALTQWPPVLKKFTTHFWQFLTKWPIFWQFFVKILFFLQMYPNLCSAWKIFLISPPLDLSLLFGTSHCFFGENLNQYQKSEIKITNHHKFIGITKYHKIVNDKSINWTKVKTKVKNINSLNLRSY